MFVVMAAALTRFDRVHLLLRFRQLLDFVKSDRHVSQEVRMNFRLFLCVQVRDFFRVPLMNRNVDRQLPDRRRLGAVLVQIAVDVERNVVIQDRMDHGVSHRVLERARE